MVSWCPVLSPPLLMLHTLPGQSHPLPSSSPSLNTVCIGTLPHQWHLSLDTATRISWNLRRGTYSLKKHFSARAFGLRHVYFTSSGQHHSPLSCPSKSLEVLIIRLEDKDSVSQVTTISHSVWHVAAQQILVEDMNSVNPIHILSTRPLLFMHCWLL